MVLKLSCIFINTNKVILYFVIVSPCLVMVDKKQRKTTVTCLLYLFLYCR